MYKLVGFAGFVYSVYMLWEEEQYKDTIDEMAEYISSVFTRTD